jgi:Predicted ATPase (AAA+ superfamily)
LTQGDFKDELDLLEDQFRQIVQEKVLAGVDMPRAELTRREASVPAIPGKAMTVIGMRRAGKTCFLHQLRRDRGASGASAEDMVYFNFEDERLAGMAATDLDLIPSVHERLFPSQGKARRAYFLDEIQLVPGWYTKEHFSSMRAGATFSSRDRRRACSAAKSRLPCGDADGKS